MSMALTSESGATSGCTTSAWTFYLWLARQYGWSEPGTRPPRRVRFWFQRWDGSYYLNEGQWVTREDASALADALERNLLDPDRAQRQRMVCRAISAASRKLALELYGEELPDESETEPLPEDKDLEELIGFFRKGSFRID
jgi:hypothetical protein